MRALQGQNQNSIGFGLGQNYEGLRNVFTPTIKENKFMSIVARVKSAMGIHDETVEFGEKDYVYAVVSENVCNLLGVTKDLDVAREMATRICEKSEPIKLRIIKQVMVVEGKSKVEVTTL